ncbi:MAG: bifunctional phosphopantothenoylcysteine decarboxylase/phosphopantothenate--cysteine ligase CoaBC, partial [Chloroflexi bacterium]
MGELTGKKILLGVTGGIAAYKSVYLLRLLRAEGAEVKVIMTEAACEFVTPLTFESLSENTVHTGMFDTGGKPGTVSPVEHIDLARWPDLVVIAPLTANTIAKLTGGAADDLLSTVVSAYDGPVVLAPAMNDVMWRNDATQKNMLSLSTRGFRVVPPGRGDLACGYESEGRMAEPADILTFVKSVCSSAFAKLRVLISAGGTEEDLDPVRVISNRSSGKMGFALAEAARNRGADVTVIMARVSATPPVGVGVVRVRTTAEMSAALKERFDECDVLVMAAAVSDFRLDAPMGNKKKGDTWTLALSRTEDILESLGKAKKNQFIIGFALETENIAENSEKKRVKKNCDLMVVNNPLEPGAAFDHETNAVTVYNDGGEVLSTGLKSKHEVA